MPQPQPEPMTVVGLSVDAFRRITAARITPTPTGLIQVRGKNGAGKSSLLDAMLSPLAGAKARPEQAIQSGHHAASSRLDLGGLIVEERYTKSADGREKAALVVTDPDGSKRKSPRALLESLTSRFADPVAFERMKPEEQVSTILEILGLSQRLEELELLERSAYDRRRDLGREVDRLSKAREEIEREVGFMPAPPEGPGLDELTAALASAKDHNAELAQWRQAREQLSREGSLSAERVKALEAELERERALLEERRAAWKEADEAVGRLGAERDTAPIVAKIEEHEDESRRRARREILERTTTEHATAAAAHAEADGEVEARRAEIRELLSTAPFPVEGMGYDPEERRLTIGGIPFSQASQAERIRAACAVAMAGDPPIRVLFVREASLLDDEGLAIIAEEASARGWQVWAERVDSTVEGEGLWIEDGEVSESEERSA